MQAVLCSLRPPYHLLVKTRLCFKVWCIGPCKSELNKEEYNASFCLGYVRMMLNSEQQLRFWPTVLQPAYFNVRAVISFIKPDQAMWYLACVNCNRKVTEESSTSYWCEGCQKHSEKCNRR